MPCGRRSVSTGHVCGDGVAQGVGFLAAGNGTGDVGVDLTFSAGMGGEEEGGTRGKSVSSMLRCWWGLLLLNYMYRKFTG